METQTNKIYVSNISYQATYDEFKEFFSQYGEVVDCRLPFDNYRVLGYGFVEFKTEEEMNKAIANDGIEFLGRPIRIEKSTQRKAKEQNKTEEKPAEPIQFKLTATKFVRSSKTHEEIALKQDEVEEDDDDYEEEDEEEISETTIFVRNLPFSVNDERFKELFKKYQVVNCHVVSFKEKGRIKSRGYGFITLENNQCQLAAIKEMNGKMVDGRAISVSAAYKWQEKKH